MDAEQRRRRTLVIAVIVLVPLLILAAWGLSLAGSAGFLPWQPGADAHPDHALRRSSGCRSGHACAVGSARRSWQC